MPKPILSDTSNEEEPDPPLTRAEKSKRTRALAEAEAKAEAARLSHEIGWFSVISRLIPISLHAAEEAGGRGAKLAAYKNKTWDPKANREQDDGPEPASRKRTASTTGDQPPKTTKKVKAHSFSDNEMDINVVPLVKSRPKSTAKQGGLPSRVGGWGTGEEKR
ncbi:hypothetical protein K438DRAFT_1932713 [Mycena galopus ATCC 62051]|nr:hypothetical protein K438DRAFT_1932713 [Mycena galopus ATCC 62051]